MESKNGEVPSPLQVVTSINEASLLATAKSGEAAAVDTLYRAHAEKLLHPSRAPAYRGARAPRPSG
jgi:hypothetical protein